MVFGYTRHMDRSLSEIIALSKRLSEELHEAVFSFSGIIYDPLSYAWDNHEAFLHLSCREGQRVLFVGMNPGPYGMMQTGVPFGEIDAVRSYLGIRGSVGKPEHESPLKPIEGMNVRRHEVSGRKFWQMAAGYGSKEEFFAVASVWNYCPLVFIDGSRNVTLPELCKEDRRTVESICDRYLASAMAALGISRAIALGRYAEKRLKAAGCTDVTVFPHPSPRSPSSTAFWDSGEALRRFREAIGEA